MRTLQRLWLAAVCAAAVLLLTAGFAYAGIDAYVITDTDQVTYKYLLDDMITSYNSNKILWNDFYTRMMRSGVHAVFNESARRFIDFGAIIDAFNRGIRVLDYTGRPDAVLAVVPATLRLVTLSNGALVQADWSADRLTGALTAVNAASGTDDMRAALTAGAETLGLDLAQYHTLNSFGQSFAAGEVLGRRPQGGYAAPQALQAVFGDGVRNGQAAIQAAVRAINDATAGRRFDPAGLVPVRNALVQHAAALDLNMARFNGLHPFAQDWVAMRMMSRGPFTGDEAIRSAFAAEVDTTAVNLQFTFTNYPISLESMTDRQMSRSPQTDLYTGTWQNAERLDVLWHVNPENFQEREMEAVRVILPASVTSLRVRRQPDATDNSNVITWVGSGSVHLIQAVQNVNGVNWFRITANSRTGWISGEFTEPARSRGPGIFQFMVMSGTVGVSESALNQLLAGRGVLQGRASAFMEGTRQHNINEIFLIGLAIHETGNGTSALAAGVVFEAPEGPRTVYNVFGIGARDFDEQGNRLDPLREGARFAYEQGWFTPELAIIGGARFSSNNYINNAANPQDTLYKMRWNPAQPQGWRQYATDIGWAVKQSRHIWSLIQTLAHSGETFTLRFDIPRYTQ